MESLLVYLPALGLYAAIVAIVPTYILENIKSILTARKTKDWSPVYKRVSVMIMSIILMWFSPTLVPMTSVFMSKLITALVVASLSSDSLYPLVKRVRGDLDKPQVPSINPFLPDTVEEKEEH